LGLVQLLKQNQLEEMPLYVRKNALDSVQRELILSAPICQLYRYEFIIISPTNQNGWNIHEECLFYGAQPVCAE